MDFKNKADILRALCLISTTEAESGHPTSCLSSADLAAILFDKYFSYDLSNPKNYNNDRFILSKGHASPLLYSVFALSGGIKRKELLTLRKFKSELEGHPTPRFKFADVATGSLGQGLSIACGIALNAKKEKLNHKTYVLLGDGEMAEGQIYEAMNFASYYGLDNLIVIVDVNNLGSSGETMFDYNLEKYNNLFFSLGFETQVIDGHNFFEIEKALHSAYFNQGKPFALIAKTIKGKGISFLEARTDFHGKALNEEDLEKALDELSLDKKIIEDNSILFNFKKPINNEKKLSATSRIENGELKIKNEKTYSLNEEVSTREAFGDTLAELGKINSLIYVIDGDLSTSTFTDKFKAVFPDRFIEGYIAEQNMTSVALGLSICTKIPVAATFGAFWERAADQIRMARISCANIKFVGSHAGIAIGEDGPSQMGIEDISLFSVYPETVIIQPSDAVSCKKMLPKILEHKGISYFRILRGKTPVIYEESEEFEIGGSKVLKKDENYELVIVSSGETVHEAIKAYDFLKSDGISICLVDAYSIKPLDKKTILDCVDNSKNKIIITVEDHSINGGLGDTVLSEFAQEDVKIIKLGVSNIPFSGDKDSLFEEFEISASKIANKVKSLISKKTTEEKMFNNFDETNTLTT